MKNPAPWLPILKTKLDAGEEVRCWLGGEFIDKPKSIRTGVLALTSHRLVFYRKKAFGEEFISFARDRVTSSEVGAFGGLIGPHGGVPELRITLEAGLTLRMSMIQQGSAEEFIAALGS